MVFMSFVNTENKLMLNWDNISTQFQIIDSFLVEAKSSF